MRFGPIGCGKMHVDCEFCPRRRTGYMRSQGKPGRLFGCCGACYRLLKRNQSDPWPRANHRVDHQSMRRRAA